MLTKNNIRRRGFTLIELLAVIAILSVIALISVPLIMNIISKAKEEALIDSAYGIIRTSQNHYTQSMVNNESITGRIDVTKDTIKYKGTKPEKGEVEYDKQDKVLLYI